MKISVQLFLISIFIHLGIVVTHAVDETRRIYRGVAISPDQIAFSYAGDIWSVPREGGRANRLTDHPDEESLPVFSPDGSRLAFTRGAGNNMDIYATAANGGDAKRITFNPEADIVRGWTPDGSAILFVSNREMDGMRRLYTVPAEGGFPEPLPLPMGESGIFSSRGERFAYAPVAMAYARTFYRYYRGGMTSPLWIADLATSKVDVVFGQDANHLAVLWRENRIYFNSDRDGHFNLYVHVLDRDATRQLTHFETHGIRWTGVSGDAIVFVPEGRSLGRLSPWGGEALFRDWPSGTEAVMRCHLRS